MPDYIKIYTHMCRHADIQIYKHAYTRRKQKMFIHAQKACRHACILTKTQTGVYRYAADSHMFTNMHTNTLTCTRLAYHTHTHAHIHVFTQANEHVISLCIFIPYVYMHL